MAGRIFGKCWSSFVFIDFVLSFFIQWLILDVEGEKTRRARNI